MGINKTGAFAHEPTLNVLNCFKTEKAKIPSLPKTRETPKENLFILGELKLLQKRKLSQSQIFTFLA